MIPPSSQCELALGISLWVRKASTLEKLAKASTTKSNLFSEKALLRVSKRNSPVRSSIGCEELAQASLTMLTSSSALQHMRCLRRFIFSPATIFDFVFCLDFPVVTALCTLKFAHFRLLLLIDDFLQFLSASATISWIPLDSFFLFFFDSLTFLFHCL